MPVQSGLGSPRPPEGIGGDSEYWAKYGAKEEFPGGSQPRLHSFVGQRQERPPTCSDFAPGLTKHAALGCAEILSPGKGSRSLSPNYGGGDMEQRLPWNAKGFQEGHGERKKRFITSGLWNSNSRIHSFTACRNVSLCMQVSLQEAMKSTTNVEIHGAEWRSMVPPTPTQEPRPTREHAHVTIQAWTPASERLQVA